MATIFSILPSLAETATRPAEATAGPQIVPSPGAVAFNHFILALGLCVLVVWIVRKVADPKRLLLHNAPGRPNGLHLAHVGALWLALQLLGLLVLPGAMALLGRPAEGTTGYFQAVLLYSIAGNLLFLPLVLVVAHVVFRHGIARGMGLSARRWLVDSVRGVLALLAVFPVCSVLSFVGAWLVPGKMQQPHPILLLLRDATVPAGWKVLAAATAILLAPLAEEMFYRGILQTALRRYFRGRWAAIAIASGLFALVHVDYQTGAQLNNTLPLFALAVALGYNYERTGRLWASILIHMLFNGISVLSVLWPG